MLVMVLDRTCHKTYERTDKKNYTLILLHDYIVIDALA